MAADTFVLRRAPVEKQKDGHLVADDVIFHFFIFATFFFSSFQCGAVFLTTAWFPTRDAKNVEERASEKLKGKITKLCKRAILEERSNFGVKERI